MIRLSIAAITVFNGEGPAGEGPAPPINHASSPSCYKHSICNAHSDAPAGWLRTMHGPHSGSAPSYEHEMKLDQLLGNYVFHTKKRQIFEDKVSMLLRFTYTPSIKAVDSVQRFSIILPFQVDFPKYCEFPSRNKALKITCNRQSITISPAGAHTVTCNEIKIPYNNATLPTCYPQSPPYTVPRQLNYFSPRSPWSMFQNLKRIV
jgi:hypothetical protein